MSMCWALSLNPKGALQNLAVLIPHLEGHGKKIDIVFSPIENTSRQSSQTSHKPTQHIIIIINNNNPNNNDKQRVLVIMPKDSPKKKAPNKMSPVKKVHTKHNIKSNLGQKARYEVHSFQTKVKEIIVSYSCRKDNSNVSAYIKPIVDYFNEEIEAGNKNISDDFRISSFMARRVEGGSLSNNNAMKSGKEGEYEWEAMVTINPDDQVSYEDVANTICLRFSRFHTEVYKQQRFVPVFHHEEENKPVNFFIQDENVVT